MNTQNGQQVAKSAEEVYAKALLELAQAENRLDEVADEVVQLDELIRTKPELTLLLESRVLSAAERAQVLDRIFKGRISDLIYRFLQVINQKNRLDLTGAIMRAFAKQVDHVRGVVEVDAFVAQRLDDAQVAQVSSKLGQVLGREVVLHQYVNPALIGGLKLRIGDQVIDASVATQLRRMRHKLTEAGRENAKNAIGTE